MKIINIYGKTNKYIENRIFGLCTNIKCKKTKPTRLNIILFENMIQEYFCDECIKRGF
jgi:hypothetical protein